MSKLNYLECVGENGIGFIYKGDLYLSISLGLENSFFIKLDKEGVYGVTSVKSNEFYNLIRFVQSEDLFTYSNLGSDLQLVYVRDSHAHRCYLSNYNPLHISPVVTMFINKIVSMSDLLSKSIKYFRFSSKFI